MKLARYWIRETALLQGMRIRARGWSDESMEAARRQAFEMAQKIATWISSGRPPKGEYLYGDRPLPEPLIQQLGDGAVVTRNAYGALVLNTDRLMFIDVDQQDEAPAPASSGFLSSLFGKKAEEPPRAKTVVQKIEEAAQRTGLRGRLYETAAGYRVIVTNREFQPASQEAEQILKDFGSDPLYIRLCRMQESFRARLTPKPWRCKMGRPYATFPFETAEEEQRYQQWVALYEGKTRNFATCRFLQNVGAGSDAVGADLIRFHDEQTGAMSGMPLA